MTLGSDVAQWSLHAQQRYPVRIQSWLILIDKITIYCLDWKGEYRKEKEASIGRFKKPEIIYSNQMLN